MTTNIINAIIAVKLDLMLSRPSVGKKFLVIGGAGFIGSHVVDQLIQEDVQEIRIFDNFTRGSEENLAGAVRAP